MWVVDFSPPADTHLTVAGLTEPKARRVEPISSTTMVGSEEAEVRCTIWMENSFYQLNKQTEPIIPSTPVLSHIFRTGKGPPEGGGRRWGCGQIAAGDENHFAGVCIIWVCRWFGSLPPAHSQKLMWSKTQPKAISTPVLVRPWFIIDHFSFTLINLSTVFTEPVC